MTQFFTCKEEWVPHKYQSDSVKFCKENPCALVLADPGMGKTSITLSVIADLKARGVINKTLVVAPLRPALDSWPGELAKWSNFKHLTHTIITSATKEKAIKEDVDIYIVTTDLVKWLFNAEIPLSNKGNPCKPRLNFDRVQSLNVDLLVIDELSKFKNTTSARTRIMLEISKLFERRIGLTGSFSPNKLEDVFSQTLIIAGDCVFGKFITKFKDKYFDKVATYGTNYGEVKPKKGAEGLVSKAIAPYSVILKSKDYLDMPELMYVNLYANLAPSAMKIYSKFEREFVAYLKEYEVFDITYLLEKEILPGAEKNIYVCENSRTCVLYGLEDCLVRLDVPEDIDISSKAEILSFTTRMKCTQPITAKNAATKAMSLRQIASGGVYRYDIVSGKEVQKIEHIHHAKTEVLKDLISELHGQPLLVLYHFKHDKKRICDLLGEIPDLSVCNTSAKLSAMISRWNFGELPIMLGQPQSMGHGLNLQKGGHHICFYSLDWSYENYDQCIRRIYRQGNKHETVFVYHILSKNTIDDYLLQILKDKEGLQTNILKYLNQYCKERDNAK